MVRLSEQSLNNILVKGDDFMISDFGLARVKEEKVKGDSGTRWPYGDRGPYLAPECHAGATIGRSADVWALGCILLDVLSFGLLGYENGVEEFRRRRTVTVQTSNDPYQLCAFYEGQFVKKKVLDWIEYLRKQQLYDSLVENYVDVIRAMLRNGPLYSGKHWLITDVQEYFQRIFDGSYSPVSRANQSRIIQQVSPPATPVGKPGIAPNIPAALSPQTGSSGHSLKQLPATTPRTPRLEDPLQQLICFDTVSLHSVNYSNA